MSAYFSDRMWSLIVILSSQFSLITDGLTDNTCSCRCDRFFILPNILYLIAVQKGTYRRLFFPSTLKEILQTFKSRKPNVMQQGVLCRYPPGRAQEKCFREQTIQTLLALINNLGSVSSIMQNAVYRHSSE